MWQEFVKMDFWKIISMDILAHITIKESHTSLSQSTKPFTQNVKRQPGPIDTEVYANI